VKLKIEISEEDIRSILAKHINEKLHINAHEWLDKDHVVIEVKSKQNWKSEWEKAAFRAVVEADQ
jgi:hypothetical protein